EVPMRSYLTPKSFVLMEHIVDPLRKRDGEGDVETLRRILGGRGHTGWEIVDVCGDELRMPNLIFRRTPKHQDVPQYLVEEVPRRPHLTEVQSVMEYLWARLAENWIPACILDSPFTTPIAVLKRTDRNPEFIKLKAIHVSPELFGRIATVL